MAQRIVKRFAPEKVILFGSPATGRAGPDSDVDLIVVMPLRASEADRELAIRAALRAWRNPKDVIVTTPEDSQSVRDPEHGECGAERYEFFSR